jgi:hypothetical protein
MEKYTLAEETLGYQTVQDPTNTDERYLIAPSKNVLIDQNRKVRSRPGFTRLGAGATDLLNIISAKTWNTSQGSDIPMRFYDDEWEAYFGTVDETEINAWIRVKNGLDSATKKRVAFWYDDAEGIDLAIMVQGDLNFYEWSGAVAVVDSVTGTTITKKGTTTWGENRFYTTGSKTLVCQRTGTEYTYTGGEGTTTLTGIADTTDLVAGDILVQKVVTTAVASPANRKNHIVWENENQLYLGSEIDETIYISKNTNFNDFGYSAPRVPGEGGLLTLGDPSRGFGLVGKTPIAFVGPSRAFEIIYKEIAVGTTLAESLTAKPIKSIGELQGALNHESIIPVGNALAYITNEKALRMLDTNNVGGELQLKALSNPIKPDFDAEDWTDATGIWANNSILLTAPTNSHVYILEYVEDADGKLRRFWQPPQVLPIQVFSIIDEALHGHSNAVPETYIMFDGLSDYIAGATIGEPDDKVSVACEAYYAYRPYGKRGVLKCHDEYFVDGEINAATNDLDLDLNYDYGGAGQVVTKVIDGTDEGILLGVVGVNSLAQASLASQSLSGLLLPPEDARKFNVTFEMPKEDWMLLQPVYKTNEIDRYWAILSHGPNVQLSPRKNIAIKR